MMYASVLDIKASVYAIFSEGCHVRACTVLLLCNITLCTNAVCVFLQVDELYEGFCIQRRLRDGASKMKQAFTASPSTKGTRESLAEVNRRYKEYTEVHYKYLLVTLTISLFLSLCSRSVFFFVVIFNRPSVGCLND